MTDERAPRITRRDLDRIERKLDQVLELLGRSASPSSAMTEAGSPTWLPGTGRLGGTATRDLSEDALLALAELEETEE